MLNATLGLVLFYTALNSAALVATGTIRWHRTLIAAAGLLLFGRYYVRMVRDTLDHRRLECREIVVAGVLALATMIAGGGEGVLSSWGFVPIAWLSVVTLEMSRRAVVLLSLGTAAVVAPTAILLLRFDPNPPGSGSATSLEVVIVITLFYLLVCVLFPWCHRLFLWIWRLAEQAHAGREAQARLAVAEERLRLARDLHDLVGHRLSAIAVKSELAARMSEADPATAREEMTAVQGLARTALRELREAVRGYRRLDFTAELGAVRGVLEAAGVDCRLHLPYREVPEEVGREFACVLREAVTNVLKHSSATRCDITVRLTPEEAVLEVRNDGVRAPQEEGVGNGLAGLAERMAELGGSLIAKPMGSGEFLLRATAPLRERVSA